MNRKELKRRLDAKGVYIWCKDTPISWRLVNAFTLKTVYGCESRLAAVLFTRKLKSMGYSVAAPAGEEE